MAGDKMSMKEAGVHRETEGTTTTPLDRLRSMSTVARKVHPKRQKAVDAMLAVYSGRLTYTFIAGHEVASIHFDKNRGEIFYKGHNIRHMPMGDDVRGYLWELAEILAHDEEGMAYSGDYSATLRKVLTDK
jgi:hypothetical protein